MRNDTIQDRLTTRCCGRDHRGPWEGRDISKFNLKQWGMFSPKKGGQHGKEEGGSGRQRRSA